MVKMNTNISEIYYYRALDTLNHPANFSLMERIEYEVGQLEFYSKNAPQLYDFGLFVDKNKRNLYLLKQIEMSTEADSNLKLRAINCKVKILFKIQRTTKWILIQSATN